MKFYDREKEIAELRTIRERSRTSAQWTVVTGRRRAGKTALVQTALGDEPFVYFYVARKAEADLCETFAAEVEAKLGVPVGAGGRLRFAPIFEAVLKAAETRHVTLFIDEFQDFRRVNPAVFSEMQDAWGRHERTAKINLVVCGSVSTLLVKIFRDHKEPLYGRQTSMMTVRPFSTGVLRAILRDHKPSATNEDLLALWTFTGGVAKYVSLLMDAKATDRGRMLREIIKENSFFLDEGRAVLVDEFGKDYGTYFSILSGIARGRTARNELEQALGTKVGGYLTRLEEDYGVVGPQGGERDRPRRRERNRPPRDLLRSQARRLADFSSRPPEEGRGVLRRRPGMDRLAEIVQRILPRRHVAAPPPAPAKTVIGPSPRFKPDKTNHENVNIRTDTSSRCERIRMDGALGSEVRLLAGGFPDAPRGYRGVFVLCAQGFGRKPLRRLSSRPHQGRRAGFERRRHR